MTTSTSNPTPSDERLPVLVGIDASGSSAAAVAWAAGEAAGRGVPLALLHAYGPAPSEPLEDDVTVSRLHAAAEALLAAVRDDVFDDHPGLDVTLEASPELAPDALLRRASQASLIVVGSHHRTAVGRLMLGSVGHSIVARAHAPVVVVRAPAAKPDGPVIVGVELPDVSPAALEFAAQEARRRHVPLLAVHAWQLEAAMGYTMYAPDAKAVEVIHDDAVEMLAKTLVDVTSRYPDVDVQTVVAHGSAPVVLADAAAESQLLVVGTHGRTGFGRLLIGSVSTNVLHAVETSLAIIPTTRPHPA